MPARLERPRLLRLGTSSDYTVPGSYFSDTRDYEDHTFSGIMFDLHADAKMPVKYIEVQNVWVRGMLGPMQVFTTPKSHAGKHVRPGEWTRRHAQDHRPSPQTLVPLVLRPPVQLRPGDSIGVYIHSSLPGDRGLVYNNQHSRVTHSDAFIKILPGLAHTSNRAFHRIGFWGHNAWRWGREFVGRVGYGCKFLLWNPKTSDRFPAEFRAVVVALSAQGPVPIRVPYDVALYILNFCAWDWFEGNGATSAEPERRHSSSRSGRLLRALSTASRRAVAVARGACVVS